MEVKGIGLAYSAYGIVMAFFMQVLPFYFAPEVREAYTLPSKEALYGWPEYIKLAVPSIFCGLVTYLPFEIVLLISGTYSEIQQAATTIVINAFFMYEEISAGDDDAAITHISNLIGANKPK